MSIGTIRITDPDFADDTVIFAETTEVLAGALDLLRRKQGRLVASFLDQDQGPGVR